MQKAFRRESSLQAAVIPVNTAVYSREPKPLFVSLTLHKGNGGKTGNRSRIVSIESLM
jgi:hypothetical protein